MVMLVMVCSVVVRTVVAEMQYRCSIYITARRVAVVRSATTYHCTVRHNGFNDCFSSTLL